MNLTDVQKNRYAWYGALAVTAAFLFIAAQTLTTSPRFWFDEGINLQIARNFAEQGYVNIQTAPGIPYDKPYQLLTTGYPVTGVLGAIFKVTGFSFAVARGSMLLWTAFLLLAAFVFAKRAWGRMPALFSLLLLATFAPLIFHGKSVIGEIPGLALFVTGLIFLDRAETRHNSVYSLAFAGLFFGLAAAAKTMYLLLIVAVVIALFLKRGRFGGAPRPVWQWALFWVALLLPVLLFVVTVIPPDISWPATLGIIESYQSRASQGHFFVNILGNVKRFFFEDALFYTFVLSALAACAIPWRRLWRGETRVVYLVLIAAGVLMLLFFLQSVGWNRYLVFYQGLLLLAVPAALARVAEHWRAFSRVNASVFRARAVVLALSILVLFQGYYLFFRSDFFSGSLGTDVETFFAEKAPMGRIYAISALKNVAMIPSAQLHQFFLFEDRQMMPNRLERLADERFEYLFLDPADPDAAPFMNDIDALYEPLGAVGDKTLFKLRIP